LDNEGWTRHGKPLGRNWVGAMTDDREVVQVEMDGLKDIVRLTSKHDIVCGYNIVKYDWPQIQRAAINMNIHLPNTFAMYDLARSVFSDQTLHGIKSRGLKSVARWYGMEAQEIDGRNTAAIPIEDLLTYNVSDLKVTRGLFDIYFPRLRELANYMGIPLQMVLEEIPSTCPSIISARGLQRKGFISDGTNRSRHPEIKGSVQGAFTMLSPSAPGAHLATGKVDVKQLYPNIILILNLGPDTTWIVGLEELQPYGVKREGKIAYYRIPDKNLNRTVVVAVDESEPSILSDYLRDLGGMRAKIKALMVGMTEGERTQSPLHAQENAIKIGRNTLYGYQLSKEAYFSDLATGIVVTGTGRTFVQMLAAEIDARWPGTVFEVDTDGIYFDATGEKYQQVVDLSDQFAYRWAMEMLSIDRGQFELDHERFKASFFAATKNYILMDEKDRVIVHGSGLKGSHRPNLLDITIAEVAPKLLGGEPVATRQYYEWSRWHIEDYLMRQALGQPIEEYAGNPPVKRIALQYLRHGEPVEVGSILEYYAAIDPANPKLHEFRAYFAEEPALVHHGYYAERLGKLFEGLGLQFGSTATIENVLDRAIHREVAAAMRGVFETCPTCNGEGWYIRRKTLDVVDCDSCGKSGKKLVIT
jgi:DNA polymerase elongation subunit (family B)